VDYVIVILAGLVFGALDQYLGTGHITSRLGWWTITVSGLSAPWLILPFAVGLTQPRARRAAMLGFIVTMTALVGYFFMSNSAFEGVPVSRMWPRVDAMIQGDFNRLWIVAGALTGPVYAYLGHRWRVARSWLAALLATAILCFEPLVRGTAGRSINGGLAGSPVVWGAEVGLGLVCAVVFTWAVLRERRRVPPPTI
jgi:Family of unknown function (DUF6518)